MHNATAKKSSGDRDRFISTAERVNTVFEQMARAVEAAEFFLI